MNIEHWIFLSEFVHPLWNATASYFFYKSEKKQPTDKKFIRAEEGKSSRIELNFFLRFDFFTWPEDVLRAFQYAIVYWTKETAHEEQMHPLDC